MCLYLNLVELGLKLLCLLQRLFSYCLGIHQLGLSLHELLLQATNLQHHTLINSTN